MIKSMGIKNILDYLSGKGYLYIPGCEDDLKDLLIGHSIKKVNEDTLELDNGIKLVFEGNEGCICGYEAGEYEITELNDCENIITNVEFNTIKTNDDDDWYDDYSYRIFVFAENKKIKLLQCDGSDGNGHYGTGYHIDVKRVRIKGEDNE